MYPPYHYKADPSYALSDATSCITKIQIEYLNISICKFGLV